MKKFKKKYFLYSEEVIDFVNKNYKIEAISVTPATDTPSRNGFYLFYFELHKI